MVFRLPVPCGGSSTYGMRAERDHSRLVRSQRGTPARTAWRSNRQTITSKERDAICYCTYWATATHMHMRKAPPQPCVCACAHTCVRAVTRHACLHTRVRSISYNLYMRAVASTWNARFASLLAYPVSPYMPTVRRAVGVVPLDYRKPRMQRAYVEGVCRAISTCTLNPPACVRLVECMLCVGRPRAAVRRLAWMPRR
jgi:hypothetical protein